MTDAGPAADHHQWHGYHVKLKRDAAVECHSVCRRYSSHRFVHGRHVPQYWQTSSQLTLRLAKVLIAFISDRLKLRGVVMLFTLPVAIAGYAAIANITSAHARFAMTCLMAIGMYSSVPCVLVWNSNNSAGHYKRATTSALQLAVANAGGFVASEFYY